MNRMVRSDIECYKNEIVHRHAHFEDRSPKKLKTVHRQNCRQFTFKGSFEHTHHMFWMRNKEDNIPIRTLIWRPGCFICVNF